MHKCNSTRKSLVDLALNELSPYDKNRVLTELRECAECREEFAQIRETLSVSNHALKSSLPAEDFWHGYHARLLIRLEQEPAIALRSTSTRAAEIWQSIWNTVTGSISIPVPAGAAALVLLLFLGTLLAWNSQKESNATLVAGTPAVITRTVTVPVPQEKIVTKVVYRYRNRSRIQNEVLNDGYARRMPGTIAPKNDESGISLVGFKPTNQVKLQVIKGTYRDEK
jgi:hypothetical protein